MRAAYLTLMAVVLFTGRAYGQDPAFPIPPPRPNAVFINVNGGFRALSQEFVQQTEFTLYGEPGIFDADHTIRGRPSFEVGAGVRVWRDLSLGASYSIGSKHVRDVTVAAEVPHPLRLNRHRLAAGTAAGLEHQERAVHVQAALRIPVTIELDVTLFGGPSFFHFEDDIVDAITPVETGGDLATVDLSRIAVSRQTHRATGFNLGFDTSYMFARHVGAGLVIRYSTASADLVLPAGSVGPAVEIGGGGFELAAGLRFRF